MKFSYECIGCHIQQILKVAKLVQMDETTKEVVVRKTLKNLSEMDYDKTNPEMMSLTWRTILSHIDNKDPYQHIKREYNQMMLSIYNELLCDILSGKDAFDMALHLAIEGNVIDYGANHHFVKEDLLEKILCAEKNLLAVDESNALYNALERAEKLLYVGDNCGEIVFDKLFIEVIKNKFPALQITFGVRGGAILNDITYEDVDQVGLNELVEIIDAGNDYPGLVIEMASEKFRHVYDEANVIIAKGQGNYEGLSQEKGKEIFFLLMAKCDMIAGDLGVRTMDKICKRAKSY